MPSDRLAWFLLAAFVGAVCLPTATPLHAQNPAELGFGTGSAGPLRAPWFLPPAFRGWRADLVAGETPDDRVCLRLAPAAPDASPTGNVMRMLPADGLQGRRVLLSARVRVDGDGRAQMWLRVDRAGDGRGAFDNMGDRALFGEGWQDARIEVDVDGDASALALGFLALGGATVFVDDVRLEVLGAAAPVQAADGAAPLTARELVNAVAASRLYGHLWFFHPSDALVDLPREQWDPFAVDLLEVALPAADDEDLARRLAGFLSPVAPAVRIWAGSASDAPPAPDVPDGATHRRYWEHRGAGRVAAAGNVYSSRVVARRIRRPIAADDRAAAAHVVALSEGVFARVPWLLWGDRRRALPESAMPPGWDERSRVVLTPGRRSTRLAAVAQAWNVFEHFYPYFDVVDVDWSAELPAALTAAATAGDEAAATEVLERLVAALRDGHGHVSGPAPFGGRQFLPVAVRWAGDQLVVAGLADDAAGARIGDVLLSIDGRPVEELFAEIVGRVSAATDGWARSRSQALFAVRPTRDPVTLRLLGPDGAERDVRLPRSRVLVADATGARPTNGAPLADGVVYFDLCGATREDFALALDVLRAADGIVFDLRGYPDSAATDVLGHLLTERGQSARWGVPVVTRPDRESWRWDENGRWNLRPLEPHLDAEVAFLTDGRAISYAESVLGIVEAYSLGEIVGARTAGTNGNVNPFAVAGGFRISWTGMRVLKHDNSRHHGVGIAATVPVQPTPAGIAAGRDEVLERAIEVLQQKLAR